MSDALTRKEIFKARFAFGVRRALNLCLWVARNLVFLRRQPPREPQCIVAHLIGHIGDIVVAVPALVALRERYPGCRLVLLTSAGHSKLGLAGARELLEGASFLNALEVYGTEEIKHPKSAWRLLKRLRAYRPDLFVSLPQCNISLSNILRNLLFARLTGARFGVGFELVTLFLFSYEQAQLNGIYQSEIARNLGHLRELGINSPAVRFEFSPLAERELERIVEVAAQAHPFVALCPGGKQVGHRWPAERFIEVAKYLKHEHGLHLLAVGSAKERELCESVLEQSGGGTNLAGELSLRSTMELLSHATFLLTNDTGPMHLAAAMGTPVVAIFGSKDLAGRWHPYGEGHELFRAQLACRQCLFAPEESDHCVGQIQVAEVLAGCERMLERIGYQRNSVVLKHAPARRELHNQLVK